ncbi:putative transmembrane protein [Senna tora]|uniref:Putative transmembrane protein n=1 Tax=Senna tora TaxID=362788 RepID=A0A834WJ79_9FABA|nr:putative transmembrane protein [Senna tora]
MADSSPYTKPPSTFPQTTNSPIRPKPVNTTNQQGKKSCSSFLFKSLLFALFLVVLPHFPSQPPDFVNQTIFTKFWELLHLLFVGIAVAYGLFSRRNVESEIETQPNVDNNNPSYVSKMFPVSSIFGDECENSCGSDEDEKRRRMMMMNQCWNFSQCYENSAVMGEQYKPQVPIPEGNFSDVRYDGNGANVVQAWNSEYYHSEPVVVVAHPYYTIGECDEIVAYKPLGLPVRSLRSTARELDSPNSNNESDSSSGSRGSFKGSVKSRDREFGDVGDFNLDQEFNDTAGSASPISWRSRSRRMEIEGDQGEFNHVAGSASSIPWQERSRRMEIEEDLGELNDVAGSASSIPWQERSRRMEIEGNQGEFDDVLGSDSPIFWQTMCGRMENEGDHGSFNDSAGSASPISWEERRRRMVIEENHEADRSSSPIPWQARSRMMENEENYSKFNDAGGSSPIPWRSRSSRMESEENHGDVTGDVTYAPHVRPLSNDETKFEPLSSQAFQSKSFSSHTSSYSSSDSITSDNVNLEAEEMGQKKTSYGSSSEIMNYQEEDSGENMTFRRSSLRNRKMASREKYAAVSRPSHFRPMSVDETQFESLGSGSFQSTGSFSSRTSLFSSLDSASSENMNQPKEDLGEKKSKSSHGSSSSSLSPPVRGRNGEASLQAFHSRGYSDGSLLQDDMKSSLKDDLTGSNGKRSEVPSGKNESDTEKLASLTKAASKAKSVRTRRASGLPSETKRAGDISTKRTDEKVEKMPQPDNVETVTRTEILRKVGSDHLLKGTSKQNLDPPTPKPEVTFSSYSKRDEQAPSKTVSKEDSFIELETPQLSLDEDKVSECVNDSGLDSEVDKKASEFIARFKAQIRLQKEASMDRSRGLRTMKRVLVSNINFPFTFFASAPLKEKDLDSLVPLNNEVGDAYAM